MPDRATTPDPDWDPRSPDVIRDQRAAYDALRERCPVAFSTEHGWSLLRHADIKEVLHNEAVFSNSVSSHISVPNGMDPPEHTRYRALINKYFTSERVATFEGGFRAIAHDASLAAVSNRMVEAMRDLAALFAAAVQCHFMGWPSSAADALTDWSQRNLEAIREQDRALLGELAREFDELVADLLANPVGPATVGGISTTEMLLRERVDERPLSPAELASILRNWTAGEVATIAAAAGILIHYLATVPGEQTRHRAAGGMPTELIDEILRVDGPLVASRRVARGRAALGGRTVLPGDRMTIIWIAGNRDPGAFEEPETIAERRDPEANLLYGSGIHSCPGAPLARLELRIFVEELLRATANVELDATSEPVRAAPPAGGWATLPLLVR